MASGGKVISETLRLWSLVGVPPVAEPSGHPTALSNEKPLFAFSSPCQEEAYQVS